MNTKKYLASTLLLLTLLLSGCGKENSALDEFKRSAAGQEVNQCVGASGLIEWGIFKPAENQNPDVRVIRAILTKGTNKFEIQWLYNLSTKVSELTFAGKPGEKTSPLMMGLDLGLFCLTPSSK